MYKYVLKRIFAAVVTTFFIATATFFMMHAVPGDPILKGKALSPEIRKNIERKYGLDKPLLVQYGIYISNMVQGDFGVSFTQENRTVNDIIKNHFPISAILGTFALFIATIGGVLFGALAALFRNRVPDRLIMLMVIVAISVPSFVFAAMSQYGITELNKFSGREILPVGGWDGFNISYMLIPSLVLGLGTMAFLVRLMRSSMLEVVNQDYIRTAKSKGISPIGIFFNHQLRNAILPVITVLGPAIAGITTGGFVVELVFSIPGLGRYFVQAVQQLDYTVIMGLTVFYGGYLVLMMILVDIMYGIIDPRISLEKVGR